MSAEKRSWLDRLLGRHKPRPSKVGGREAPSGKGQRAVLSPGAQAQKTAKTVAMGQEKPAAASPPPAAPVRADRSPRPAGPPPLAELLKRCFRREPDERPKDMIEIVSELQQIYQQTTGAAYSRPAPRPAEALADSLNNRAVSLLDLGKPEESEKLLEQALKAHPGHPQATYNRGLRLWRTVHGTDADLLTQLEEIRKTQPKDWTAAYCLGLVHLERLDAESAVQVRKEAVKLGGGTEVQGALDQARALLPHGPRCLRTFEGHTELVTSVAFSADGCWALSGSSDTTLRLQEVATGRCLRTFEGHTELVYSVAFSADGHWALSGSSDTTLRLWELDWEFEACDPADWNEGARPHLANFLTLHTPYAAVLPRGHEPSQEEIALALTRRGRPSWTDEDFQELIRCL